MNSSVTLEITQRYRTFTSRRKYMADRIQRNLDKVEAWQKRLEKRRDNSIELVTKKRLEDAFKLAEDNGIKFKTTKGGYYGRFSEVDYERGTIKLPLRMFTNVSDKGVALDFCKVPKDGYSWTKGKRVLRIFVGKDSKVTNTVLQAVMPGAE